mmetsp:Transcript_87220/g.154501  ORF Transcript_87220/g.154501 Transcript_87220/m.154501 type:complete len:227 (+) Transcript_87220:66-746(+)
MAKHVLHSPTCRPQAPAVLELMLQFSCEPVDNVDASWSCKHIANTSDWHLEGNCLKIGVGLTWEEPTQVGKGATIRRFAVGILLSQLCELGGSFLCRVSSAPRNLLQGLQHCQQLHFCIYLRAALFWRSTSHCVRSCQCLPLQENVRNPDPGRECAGLCSWSGLVPRQLPLLWVCWLIFLRLLDCSKVEEGCHGSYRWQFSFLILFCSTACKRFDLCFFLQLVDCC